MSGLTRAAAAVTLMAEAFAGLSRAAAGAVTAAAEYAGQVSALSRALRAKVQARRAAETAEPVAKRPRPWLSAKLAPPWLTYQDRLRLYARRYNALHPGRRISWRRLTRAQIAAALDEKRRP